MNRSARTGLLAAGMAIGMTGVGYAAVPLYRIFCQVTGFGGTTMRAEGPAPGALASGKTITVRFDANHQGVPWEFKPEAARDTVAIGARDIAFYTAKNLSSVPTTGTATFNVTPAQAGKYFSKIQCFCFTNQTLQPGVQMRMPVIFYVDPAILDDPDARDIEEITLSYTFYPVDEADKQS